ncbi:MOSC domain-containing protein [Marinivivus vitaminiproducens]|uniref:MOSC domain-containing protein n=1 Tax=Marinivivus vitaminiproducens TaxID=3035935 RepID=UPI0027A88400|nr:MOSC domain-containing protein [Geminicoccaceae bacterium SCSIO 64248]
MVHPGLTLTHMWRYPIKGMPGQALPATTLATDERLPGDRRHAFAESTAPLDFHRPAWLHKRHFAQYVRAPGMAAVAVDLQDEHVTLRAPGHDGVSAHSDDPEGRLATWLAGVLGRPPDSLRFVRASSGGFTDDQRPFLSILGAATMEALAGVGGRPVDPLRFRGNLLLDGLGPFGEFHLVGRTLTIGEVEIEVVERITRCVATTIEPATAERNLEVPLLLRRHFGHNDCGVFARVVRGGRVEVGIEARLGS